MINCDVEPVLRLLSIL